MRVYPSPLTPEKKPCDPALGVSSEMNDCAGGSSLGPAAVLTAAACTPEPSAEGTAHLHVFKVSRLFGRWATSALKIKSSSC